MTQLLELLALTCVLSSVACSASLPTPDPARQPRSEYLPVPYPPPAAFAEVVPPRPVPDALWVVVGDGLLRSELEDAVVATGLSVSSGIGELSREGITLVFDISEDCQN